MEVGAVGFHNENLCKYIKDVRKDKLILKRIEKTRVESFPNLEELKE